MQVKKTNINPDVNILATDEFTAIPIKVATPSGEGASPIVKAGTPITAAGVGILAGTNAIGILLHDVDTSVNPNGALVVAGVIDYTKIVAHASVTATAAELKTAIPTLVFRSNIGTNS